MSDPTAIRTPVKPQDPRRRLFGWRWVWLALGILFIVFIVWFSLWWPRRAVWSILAVGGRPFAVRTDVPAKKAVTDSIFPATTPLANETSQVVRTWLTADANVMSVYLANSNVDHHWLPHLKTLASLQTLALHARQIGPELNQLADLAALQSLVIYHANSETPLENLRELRRLHRIRFVNPQSPLPGLKHLGEVRSLREIEFVSLGGPVKSWADLLQDCRNWSTVETLTIRCDQGVTPGLSELKACRSLTDLELSVPLSHADFVDLAGMDQLRSLTVNARTLIDDDLAQLAKLKYLTSLKVFSTGLNPTAVERLRQSMPDCEIETGP